jgi:hypothetical protein
MMKTKTFENKSLEKTESVTHWEQMGYIFKI